MSYRPHNCPTPQAERLEILLEENDLSILEACEKLYMSKHTLISFRQGSRKTRSAGAIADFFNVSTNWLLGKCDINDRKG